MSFGDPISLRGYLARANVDFRSLPATERFAAIEKLGRELMDAVGRVIPALPVSLVATVMLEAGDKPLTAFELKARVAALIDQLEATGAHVHIPRTDRDYAIDVGLRMLTLRHFVIDEDGTYRANPAERPLLTYYANAISHLIKPQSQSTRGVQLFPRPVRELV